MLHTGTRESSPPFFSRKKVFDYLFFLFLFSNDDDFCLFFYAQCISIYFQVFDTLFFSDKKSWPPFLVEKSPLLMVSAQVHHKFWPVPYHYYHHVIFGLKQSTSFSLLLLFGGRWNVFNICYLDTGLGYDVPFNLIIFIFISWCLFFS